ncbi:MAG: NlpC/P60 family protein [Candidatus Rokubacteria bacterium]|nr:NlpC/P60 family protein [Candidatus Rokubacteria bacterium]
MNAFDDDLQPMADLTETPRSGGRGLTLALLIGLVVCALLAIGAIFYAQKQIATLTQARDAAQRDSQRLTATSAAAAANAAKAEQSLAAARVERGELALLVVALRQNPNTGKDIKDPALPASITGKRRDALTAAFALKQEKVPFKWAGKKKEDGLDSAAFAALILAQAGVIDKPEAVTAKSLQGQLKVGTEGEPQPGDLLFFDGGNVMLYLGGDNAVGMLPEGAVTKNGVIKGKGIGFRYLGYGPIKYE